MPTVGAPVLRATQLRPGAPSFGMVGRCALSLFSNLKASGTGSKKGKVLDWVELRYVERLRNPLGSVTPGCNRCDEAQCTWVIAGPLSPS